MRKATILSVAALVTICMASQMSAADTKLKTGDPAPKFTATSTDGKEINLDSFKSSDVVVVVFTCNACPVAKAYETRLKDFVNKYEGKNVSLVALNNNHTEDLNKMKEYTEEKDFNFVYAYDGSGASGRAFGAKVTPHFFVLDKNRKLAYQGAFDDQWKSEPSEHYVADAVDALLAGKKVPVDFHKASGCSIKWAPAATDQ